MSCVGFFLFFVRRKENWSDQRFLNLLMFHFSWCFLQGIVTGISCFPLERKRRLLNCRFAQAGKYRWCWWEMQGYSGNLCISPVITISGSWQLLLDDLPKKKDREVGKIPKYNDASFGMTQIHVSALRLILQPTTSQTHTFLPASVFQCLHPHL